MSAILQIDTAEGDQFHRFTCSKGVVTGLVVLLEAGQEHSSGSAIHEWSSAEPGRGHSKRALIELRSLVGPYIEAIEIGADEQDPSFTYWVAMAEQGLVDRLEDDDRIEVPFRRKTQQRLNSLDLGVLRKRSSVMEALTRIKDLTDTDENLDNRYTKGSFDMGG